MIFNRQSFETNPVSGMDAEILCQTLAKHIRTENALILIFVVFCVWQNKGF